MTKVNYWGRRVGAVAAAVGSAGVACAQTNTVSGVTSSLTTGLGSGLDLAIGIGVVSTGIGLVVYLIKKGIKLRS